VARVKRAVNAQKKRREILEQASGYRGQRSRLYRKAKEQVLHSATYNYRDRKVRKSDFRRLWIQRINAAARANGMTYNRLIQGLKAAEVEVDRRISLDDAAVLSILQKEIKLRKEALEEAKKANRTDLASDAQAEIEVLTAFLPKGLDEAELRALVQAAIEEAGAAGPSEMGKVMKVLLPKVAGRAPGDQVSAMVRELLQK